MADFTVKVLGGVRLQLTYEEVVASLAVAGWPENEWMTATAVIAAESDRVCNIYNTYKSGHYGLMQMSASAHPAWFKALPNKNAWTEPSINCKGGLTLWRQSKYQPWEAYTNGRYAGFILQAQAAVSSYKSKRKKYGSATATAEKIFRPKIIEGLVSLQMGAGLQSVADAIAGDAKLTADTVQAAGDGTASAVNDVADAVNAGSGGLLGAAQLALGAGKWLGDAGNWLRIVQVIAGGALLIGGIAIVAKPATAAAGKVATAVTPVGRAVKSAGGAIGSAASKVKGAAA
ncbi:hypothetical protein JGS39_24095 [Streptomyces sp. P01-B04]|uniref:hypothetical protein n=1 Tax=Streptomyces poriferorum TaxID=2798799 RepID=UPI001C5D427F|nr:hypothetical protein [Streptomyces poriferorum]MBW5252044.1 hypothetical protein [Streptomyces poriferorum]MBW5260214.1 hypothetical protein [Streptomyces poriferorum]